MDWLKVNSVDELKKFGKMKSVMSLIKKDIEKLFKDKKCKEKNIVSMIVIKSRSWTSLYEKIVALREVISYIDYNIILKDKNIDNKNKCNEYFNDKASEYIFYLLELSGKSRADKLNIQLKHYSNKKEAKLWRDSIAKVIHPDKCKLKKADKAISKLNQLYEDMVNNE